MKDTAALPAGPPRSSAAGNDKQQSPSVSQGNTPTPSIHPNLGRPPVVANAAKLSSTNTPGAAGDSGSRSCAGAAGNCHAAPQGPAAKQEASGQGSQQCSLAEVHMHNADLNSNQAGSAVQQPPTAGLPQAGSRSTATQSPQQVQVLRQAQQQQQMQMQVEQLKQDQQEPAEQQQQQQQQERQPALAALPASFAASAAAQTDVPGLQQAAAGTGGLQWPAELTLMQPGLEAEGVTRQPEHAHKPALPPLAPLVNAMPPTTTAQHVAAPSCGAGTSPHAEAPASPTTAAAVTAATVATATSTRPATGVPELPAVAQATQTAPAGMAAVMRLPSPEARPKQQPGELSEAPKVRLVSIEKLCMDDTECSAAVITSCRHERPHLCD